MEKVQLEKLSGFDYDVDENGVKTVSFDGLEKRQRNLYKLQELHRPIMKAFLNSLGYEIVKEWSEDDGWGDGLKIDHFQVRDKRDDKTEMHLTGSDDNTAIYEVVGGKALRWNVPNTIPWYKMEKGGK
ncbi:hypothetical protein CMI37_38445 [Candidatus Pacearchaeota archaeon]|nr:hypothetical protein [Candidatus Pacearchaeota archaeon]